MSAVDEMPVRDRRMGAQPQLWLPVHFFAEETFVSSRKSRDPIQITDERMFIEFDEVGSLANCHGSDPSARSHLEPVRTNDRETNPGCRMYLVSKSSNHDQPAKRPGKNEHDDRDDLFHCRFTTEQIAWSLLMTLACKEVGSHEKKTSMRTAAEDWSAQDAFNRILGICQMLPDLMD